MNDTQGEEEEDIKLVNVEGDILDDDKKGKWSNGIKKQKNTEIAPNCAISRIQENIQCSNVLKLLKTI